MIKNELVGSMLYVEDVGMTGNFRYNYEPLLSDTYFYLTEDAIIRVLNYVKENRQLNHKSSEITTKAKFKAEKK